MCVNDFIKKKIYDGDAFNDNDNNGGNNDKDDEKCVIINHK